MPDQLVGYWDGSNKQFQGPGNVPSGSVETMQVYQATGASATIPLGAASRPGKIVDARIAAIVPETTNATYTVDFRKNGVSILTGATPISLLYTAARVSVVGTLDPTKTTVAAGDFFEVVIVFTIGTGAAPGNVMAQLGLILN